MRSEGLLSQYWRSCDATRLDKCIFSAALRGPVPSDTECVLERSLTTPDLRRYAFAATTLQPRLSPSGPNSILWEVLGRALQPRPAVWLTEHRFATGEQASEGLALTYGPGVVWDVAPDAGARLVSGRGTLDKESRVWPSFGKSGGCWETLLTAGSATTSVPRILEARFSKWRQDDSFLISTGDPGTRALLAGLLGGASKLSKRALDDYFRLGFAGDTQSRGPHKEEHPPDGDPLPLPEDLPRVAAISRSGGVTIALPPTGEECVSLSAAYCNCRHGWAVWASRWQDKTNERRWATFEAGRHICTPAAAGAIWRHNAEIVAVSSAARRALRYVRKLRLDRLQPIC